MSKSNYVTVICLPLKRFLRSLNQKLPFIFHWPDCITRILHLNRSLENAYVYCYSPNRKDYVGKEKVGIGYWVQLTVLEQVKTHLVGIQIMLLNSHLN